MNIFKRTRKTATPHPARLEYEAWASNQRRLYRHAADTRTPLPANGFQTRGYKL